ncbi:hypothetical protein ACFL6X_08180 [Candidatus Latescibacterota bacterium]
MAKKKPRSGGVIVLEQDLVTSPAFTTLTGKSIHVLLNFMGKRQMKKLSHPRRNEWTITNNGYITYSYAEAEKQGIARSSFMRALDQLVEYGFLDVAVPGTGLYRSKSRYALSDRWKLWGTDQYQEASRPRSSQARGFRPGHPHYPAAGTHGDL